VDTPRSQGAAGFLSKAGRIDLSGISIESGNEFASVLVVALDENGYATRKSVTTRGGADAPLVVELAPDAIYHLVQRP